MKVVILGAGESGVGAAILARKEQYEVFVSDKGTIKDHFKEELNKHHIPFEEKQHTEKKIFVADLIIKSPGIPDTVPLIEALREKGIPVISEIEFASRHTNATLVAITGSNGKTTTTKLIHHLLKTGGLKAGLGGNIGYSFARLIATDPQPCYVLELSSFQLDGIRQFRPDFAVLLNITPDHLDRYAYQLSRYVASKFRITLNQQAPDWLIYNGDDPLIAEYLEEHPIQASSCAIREGYFRDGKILVGTHAFEVEESALRGRHNYFNARCAIEVALRLGVEPGSIQEALNSFVTVPHRLEKVAVIDGVTYINDSKATNVDAVYYALEAMEQPLVWVVGGIDKGNDYSLLQDLVKEKVKAIVCLGVDNHKIRAAFAATGMVMKETRTAEAAVAAASRLAKAGDTVLLSPACSSFDLFNNYAERGDLFKAAVLRRIH